MLIFGERNLSVMTNLQELLQSKENEHIEFKSVQNNFHFDDLLKYISAFANEGGGNLVLGVNNEKQIVGTTVFKAVEKLKVDILSSQKLSRKVRIEVEEIEQDGKRVLTISIPSRPKGEAVSFDGAYFMRSGQSLVPMDSQTLKKIFKEYEEDFSAEICDGVKFEDLDKDAIRRLKELWSKKSGNKEILCLEDNQSLIDLGLIVNSSVTYAALILTGKKEAIDYHLRNAEIIWEYRRDVSSIEYQDRLDFREPFLLYFDKLWDKINSRNEIHPIQEGLFVFDIKAFNEEVIREAVLNAICHRDYKDQGSSFIKQYPTKIEIISPGGFLPGITPANIVEVASKPRNRLIIEVFQKIGFAERSGQGVDKIFKQTIREGKGIPDYSESTDFFVKLVIDAVVRDKKFVKYLERISNETRIYLSVTDLIVLEKIKNGEIISKKTNELKRLLENGFVEKVGRGRGTKFILSKKYYEHVGKKGEYTRRKGLDKEANKLLIIEHLKNYKKGYIEDFVEALRDIPRYTINRYLRELKEGGKIELIGNPRIVKGDKKAFWRLKQ